MPGTVWIARWVAVSSGYLAVVLVAGCAADASRPAPGSTAAFVRAELLRADVVRPEAAVIGPVPEVAR